FDHAPISFCKLDLDSWVIIRRHKIEKPRQNLFDKFRVLERGEVEFPLIRSGERKIRHRIFLDGFLSVGVEPFLSDSKVRRIRFRDYMSVNRREQIDYQLVRNLFPICQVSARFARNNKLTMLAFTQPSPA